MYTHECLYLQLFAQLWLGATSTLTETHNLLNYSCIDIDALLNTMLQKQRVCSRRRCEKTTCPDNAVDRDVVSYRINRATFGTFRLKPTPI